MPSSMFMSPSLPFLNGELKIAPRWRILETVSVFSRERAGVGPRARGRANRSAAPGQSLSGTSREQNRHLNVDGDPAPGIQFGADILFHATPQIRSQGNKFSPDAAGTLLDRFEIRVEGWK